jgi:enoyl-CoA hydratase/carnithine racemase
MADCVLYEVTEGLATVTLNRPEAMNALDTGPRMLCATACGRLPAPLRCC